MAGSASLTQAGPLLLRGTLSVEGDAGAEAIVETDGDTARKAAADAGSSSDSALPEMASSEDYDAEILTGSIGSAADAEVPPETPSPVAGNTANPTRLQRPAINGLDVEDASTGLSGKGRVIPVTRFSERVLRVERLQQSAGTGLADAAFDGETRFDAPEGFRLGTFTITPEVTLRGGFSDNVDEVRGGEAGSYAVLTPSLTAVSNWSRHEATASLSGSWTTYSGDQDADKSLAARLGLRLDLARGLTGTGSLAYSYSQESSSTAESAGGADDVHDISGEVGLARDLGIVSLAGTLGVDRSQYVGSGTSSEERDNTLYSAGLRLSADTGAVLRPFAQGKLLLRRFDGNCSGSCLDRSATGYELRLGTEIDHGSKLAGDISAGWRAEHLEDDSLPDLGGLIAGANLVWSPTRSTTMTSGLSTSFKPTSLSGSSGSIIYAADVRIAHDFSDRLVGELGAGYSHRHYEGIGIDETTATGLAGVTFALTRNAALQAQYTYTAFSSSERDADYDENTIEAGVRIRH